MLLAFLAPQAAFAHADLAEAEPADGATVEGTPGLVSLLFTEPQDVHSSIELVGPSGPIATAGPAADDPLTMRLAPPPLNPGSYTVRWTAVGDDGHIERGTVTFTVTEPPPTPAPSPTPPSPAPTPTATAATTPAPPTPSAATSSISPSPAPDPSDGGGAGADVGSLLAILVVAVVIGIVTRRLLRAGRGA